MDVFCLWCGAGAEFVGDGIEKEAIMKILYLNYGVQSGVTLFFSNALRDLGNEVKVINVAEDISYRMKNFKFFNLRPVNLLNTFMSALKFGGEWKECFHRTDFAFSLMSDKAYDALSDSDADIVLQAGAMFNPFRKKDKTPGRLFVLYLDHTCALSKKHPDFGGIIKYPELSDYVESMEKDVYKKADMIFTMSENVRSSLIMDYGVDGEKVFVIGAGPNIDAIPDFSHDRHYDGETILFVGKDFYRKGGVFLLDAFKKVKDKLKNVKLHIVGYSLDRGIDGVASYGQIGWDKIVDFYKKASLFVMPTLKEPFGLAFLEAMAYQLPCIGTYIEAVPEIIENNVNGLLVEPANPDALGDAIISILSDKELMRKMGANGYSKVKDYYNWPATASRFMDIVKQGMIRNQRRAGDRG